MSASPDELFSQPYTVLSSHAPLPLPLSELRRHTAVFLADLSLHHTGSHAKFDDSTTNNGILIKSTRQERAFWHGVFLSLLQSADTLTPLRYLEVHSTAQTMINESIREYGPMLPDTSSSRIVVQDLVMSGRSWEHTWLNWVTVKRAFVIRGCRHLFGSRSWNYLGSVDPAPPCLILQGGSDMGECDLMQCLKNIAFTQRIRQLKELEPIKEIFMRFDMSEDLKNKCQEAWNQLPEAYKSGTEFLPVVWKEGYAGPSNEVQRFRSATEYHYFRTPPTRSKALRTPATAYNVPSTPDDPCGCDPDEIFCAEDNAINSHFPSKHVHGAPAVSAELRLQDSVCDVVEDIFVPWNDPSWAMAMPASSVKPLVQETPRLVNIDDIERGHSEAWDFW